MAMPTSIRDEGDALIKSHVKGHYRKNPKTGKRVWVKPHDTKTAAARGKAPAGKRKAKDKWGEKIKAGYKHDQSLKGKKYTAPDGRQFTVLAPDNVVVERKGVPVWLVEDEAGKRHGVLETALNKYLAKEGGGAGKAPAGKPKGGGKGPTQTPINVKGVDYFLGKELDPSTKRPKVGELFAIASRQGISIWKVTDNLPDAEASKRLGKKVSGAVACDVVAAPEKVHYNFRPRDIISYDLIRGVNTGEIPGGGSKFYYIRKAKGKVKKSLPYCPVSLAEETELAKSHVKGYYRKDPRTGDKIHVKPHERKGEAKRKAAKAPKKKAAAKTKAPDVSSGKSKYPYFRDPSSGYEHPCIGHGIDIRSGWEWYAFEKQEPYEGKAPGDTIYFGFVHGYVDELGYFSAKELRDNGIPFTTDLRDLHQIMPPHGWEKVERPVPSKCPKCGSAGRKEAPTAGNYECGGCGASYAKPKARAAAKSSPLEAAIAAYDNYLEKGTPEAEKAAYKAFGKLKGNQDLEALKKYYSRRSRFSPSTSFTKYVPNDD